MEKEIKIRLDEAINSPEPEKSLINVSRELKHEGWTQLEIYDVFENYMLLSRELLFLTEIELDAKEDAITGALDIIYGWCGEEFRLFPHTLSNDEIKEYQKTKKAT